VSDLAGTIVPAEFRTFCEGGGTDSTKLGRTMRKMSKMNTKTSNFPLKFCHYACMSECNTFLPYSVKRVKCMKYINLLFMDHGRIRQRKPLSPSPKLSRFQIFDLPTTSNNTLYYTPECCWRIPTVIFFNFRAKNPPGLLLPLSS
jgi:hypothetical protein